MTELFGATQEELGDYDSFYFETSLMGYNEKFQTLNYLKCRGGYLMACKVKFSRAYTPLLYYLSPPVVYAGSETSFWVNPMQA